MRVCVGPLIFPTVARTVRRAAILAQTHTAPHGAQDRYPAAHHLQSGSQPPGVGPARIKTTDR